MKTLNDYCREQFGEKLYKLSLSAGCTCPNRDGTVGTGGCIFCSAGGSGDFAGDAAMSVEQQIVREKQRVAAKYHGTRYIAYFQPFTNTYGDIDRLERLYRAVITRPDIAALSLATRPDCLGGAVPAMLGRLRAVKPVWVELGLQTIHPASAAYIRRGYDLPVYDAAVRALRALDIHTVVHLILGLPGESEADMLASVDYVVRSGAGGIKLQLLHVLEGTDLAEDWRAGHVPVMEPEDYAALVARCVARLPEDMVVHRLTGDGPKKLLLAPLWSGDKKRVINALHAALAAEDKMQQIIL